jgi:hypothetical protein
LKFNLFGHGNDKSSDGDRGAGADSQSDSAGPVTSTDDFEARYPEGVRMIARMDFLDKTGQDPYAVIRAAGDAGDAEKFVAALSSLARRLEIGPEGWDQLTAEEQAEMLKPFTDS